MNEVKWLLIDSCGPVATLAIGQGERVLGRSEMVGRGFSAEWPGMLRRLMVEAAVRIQEIGLIAVVTGPGSFTGVRVGLAAAKGLCAASGARLIALSRLETVARLASPDEIVALDAGRDEFYVRDGEVETLMTREELLMAVAGRPVVTLDQRVVDVAGARLLELKADSALPLMLERWKKAIFVNPATIDANYVRGEQQIYARKAAANG